MGREDFTAEIQIYFPTSPSLGAPQYSVQYTHYSSLEPSLALNISHLSDCCLLSAHLISHLSATA